MIADRAQLRRLVDGRPVEPVTAIRPGAVDPYAIRPVSGWQLAAGGLQALAARSDPERWRRLAILGEHAAMWAMTRTRVRRAG